jgi:hypothetical protein
MHRQVLRLSETVLGKEHPGILVSRNNLALVLSDQGKYERAEEMHQQVLRPRKTVLGKEHPDTLASMNLAGVLKRMHRPGNQLLTGYPPAGDTTSIIPLPVQITPLDFKAMSGS